MGQRIVRAAVAAAVVSALAWPAAAAANSPTVAAYQTSWTHRALGLQYRLSSDMPFRNLPWDGTHNSFNSRAEMGPTLSDTDSNQIVDLTDQLDLDIRKLEIDIHWFPSAQGGGFTPVVCHARGGTEANFGCTVEKPLSNVLDEIGGWLREPAHRDQVLLLYIEDDLDDQNGDPIQQAYDTSAGVVDQKLGDLLYKPADAGCNDLPLTLSRRAIRRAGKQVIVAADSCGVGTAWPAVAFNWVRKQGRVFDYSDFPTCGVDYTRAEYDQNMIRYWHDVTFLTSHAEEPDDGIPPETAAEMARCGVDLIDLDNLTPDDGRLDALVWSWAEGQPGGRRCAVQRVNTATPFGRWFTLACASLRRPACRVGGRWFVGAAYVTESGGQASCDTAGGRFAVPRTGYEAQLLRLAMADAGVEQVWLGYRRLGDRWTTLDPRRP
jgi:hypothetical protein